MISFGPNDLFQISTIEASTASTIVTTATILKNVFSSKMRSRNSSGEAGWVNFSDVGLKQEKID